MTTHQDPAVRAAAGSVPAGPHAAVAPPATAGRHTGPASTTDWADGVDTVQRATATGDELQPYAELGLRDDEYDRIRHILGRRPTQAELAMYSIMWSEHCSYKSSKVHLRQFGEKAPPSDRLLAGIGENAGVVRVSDTLAVTFKVESHNHPSFVEPYQGAATGVGGIVRDILAMGARPVAVMDPLRFGAADHPDTARVLPGVVAGVGGYGNCLGLPNIGGELVFDPCYQGNPLLNALCLGVLPVDRLQKKDAAGPGNVVVLLGAKTGRDGIGGVSVLASATFDEGSEQRRPSVQVGDPFIEKLLIEACLELYDAELVVGIQDLGGAGLTCALTETAASAGTGMRVWLERVPLREPSMEPHEILASESQERMLLVVTPEKLEAVLKTAEKWGVLATAIGEVTAPSPDGRPGRLLVTWNDHVVVDVPPGSLVDDGPVYARPMREPADLILLQADRAETLPRPGNPEALRETLLRMIASPNLADKTWVTEQYDRYVLGNTVLAQPEDSGVIRIDEQSGLGVALSVDGNGRYARLDPYQGTKLALAEAYRNVAVTGAQPIAVTNCLNFGSPEDPGVMWQFAEAVRGLADGCLELGIPVTGGNVSFYNQTGAAAIHPTPVVGVLGVLDNVADRVPMGFVPRANGDHDQVYLLGDTHVELSGSEWAWVTHEHLGGMPPQVDLGRERQLAELMAAAARVGHLSSAHDLSDGGLAQSLVESSLRRGVGVRIGVPERFADGSLPFVFLFSESSGRALVTVPRGHEKAFTALCAEHGVPWELIGVTDPAGGALDVHGQFRIGLDELRAAHTATLPRLFGGPEAAQVQVEAVRTGTTTIAPATAGQPVDVPDREQPADADDPAGEVVAAAVAGAPSPTGPDAAHPVPAPEAPGPTTAHPAPAPDAGPASGGPAGADTPEAGTPDAASPDAGHGTGAPAAGSTPAAGADDTAAAGSGDGQRPTPDQR
ncbi:phosphoribosylformylglycinamidine synthase subunit PurL [Micromonospora rifamycinica]|uniref:Phosphoribosylformylglycinamidine synthase subunit PurL n=1 Tax=Micromonospora rifamycinica TaxID=291594 RepID=A0A109INB8_9ACTN|nr:phosphoribosylformylglycinamidine synthase subunit PurL [Micromonospora rifamycinica]KWV33728.1 phosphoribosylformylglycinamidine synthase [Micromonospora rifamycinica]SCG70778.1 phosphoribosylformylglycinamidine synthase subunit II [Micromonospora rifamycinica]